MIRGLLCALLAAQLFACASLTPVEVSFEKVLMEGNGLNVLAVKDWRLIGRLSVQDAKKSWLSRLEWRHSTADDVLIISTSLGGVHARLRFVGSRAYLTEADGVTRELGWGELESLLGSVPPVQQLKYWLRGLPDPSRPVSKDRWLAAGVREFTQDDWRIRLERMTGFDGVYLPKKITIIGRGVKVKLVIEEWLN